MPSAVPDPEQGRSQSAPCRHERYERHMEDPRFIRSRCLRCSQSWVEVDISVPREQRVELGERSTPIPSFGLEL